MAPDLEAVIRETMWLPRVRRDSMARSLQSCTPEARALLSFALATGSVPAADFWNEVCSLRDPDRRFTDAFIRHGITVAGARSVPPSTLREAFLTLKKADPRDVPRARAAFLALGGSGASLANAHGIYVSATRKAQKASLPKEPPHLGGPVPELTVYETVEVALAMARFALAKKPDAEAKGLIDRAERQLAWARGGRKGREPAGGIPPPAQAKAKGPAFAVARAALKEAYSTDHVSARGTSIKSAVMWGLELGEEEWLAALDEALMLADARAAWEKRNQRTSSPMTHLVWRGGDKTTRLWLVRMESGKYALLAKLGRKWTTVEGDLESVAATVPDAWFAKAMPVIEKRR